MNDGTASDHAPSAQPDSAALRAALIGNLYADALVLADEARGWFDARGPFGAWSDGDVSPAHRVAMACESLRLTTRLMHVLAWLLTQRAVAAGEITAAQATSEAYRLGDAAATDAADLAGLPDDAQRLISASVRLYDRVARLALRHGGASGYGAPSMVHRLQDQLRATF